jgi:hypothetical protein
VLQEKNLEALFYAISCQQSAVSFSFFWLVVLLTCCLVVFIFPTASVAFAAACAFGVWVEGVSAFTFKLSVFFYQHFYSNASENHRHNDESWD